MSEKIYVEIPLVTEQIVDCSVAQAWDALIDQEKMRVWYFSQLIEFKPIVGFKFRFANDGSEYHKAWQVLEVVNQEKLVHSWTYIGYTGSSTVCFELITAGTGIKVKVTHAGIASFPHHPHFARARFETGWRTILGVNLKNFLERTS